MRHEAAASNGATSRSTSRHIVLYSRLHGQQQDPTSLALHPQFTCQGLRLPEENMCTAREMPMHGSHVEELRRRENPTDQLGVERSMRLWTSMGSPFRALVHGARAGGSHAPARRWAARSRPRPRPCAPRSSAPPASTAPRARPRAVRCSTLRPSHTGVKLPQEQ